MYKFICGKDKKEDKNNYKQAHVAELPTPNNDIGSYLYNEA